MTSGLCGLSIDINRAQHAYVIQQVSHLFRYNSENWPRRGHGPAGARKGDGAPDVSSFLRMPLREAPFVPRLLPSVRACNGDQERPCTCLTWPSHGSERREAQATAAARGAVRNTSATVSGVFPMEGRGRRRALCKRCTEVHTPGECSYCHASLMCGQCLTTLFTTRTRELSSNPYDNITDNYEHKQVRESGMKITVSIPELRALGRTRQGKDGEWRRQQVDSQEITEHGVRVRSWYERARARTGKRGGRQRSSNGRRPRHNRLGSAAGAREARINTAIAGEHTGRIVPSSFS